jgi:hypothetical protein
MISRILISASAGIILSLGSVHLAILDPQVQPPRKAVGDGHEAGCAAHLRRNHDVEGLDRHPRQSRHGFGAVRPDLWLPGAVPMGCAAEVAFFDWPRIAVAGWVQLVGPNLLVQDSFDRGLFSHAVLPRGTCWHICTRMREAKRRRFSEAALSSCLSLLLADVTRSGASIKQRLSVLQRRANPSFQIADDPLTGFVYGHKAHGRYRFSEKPIYRCL